MAGSYQHLTDGRGNIVRDPDTGGIEFGMIENLGDAKECIEEMVGMVWYLSSGRPEAIEEASRFHGQGLNLAGVKRLW